VGVSGGFLNFTPFDDGGLKHVLVKYQPVDMLEGITGIAYRAKFFDQNIFEIINEPAFCYNSDDLYIAFYLAQNGIERRTAHMPELNAFNTYKLPHSFGNDALHRLSENQSTRYKKCITYLHAKFPMVAFKE
jgi:hypothetical protein